MNPYKIPTPALISFSGGRTSAFMLWSILNAYDGKLPDGVVVAFANTGKELPETLDFVQQCQTRWNVPITWVEWDETAPFIKVTNRTSRSGCSGAIGKNAIVPRRVAEIAEKSDTILDFGSGPKSNHVEVLLSQGFNVIGFDFGANFSNNSHKFDALHRKYDIVYASNVINTMEDDEGLNLTLDQIAGCTKKTAIFNLPKEPRKKSWVGKVADVDKLTKLVDQRFGSLAIENGRTAPIFICKEPKIKEAPLINVGFNIVSHNSASRDGEPFSKLIKKKNYLPNALARFCTSELKIYPLTGLMRTIHGFEKWANVIGIRADEPRRFEKNSTKTNNWGVNVMPLVHADITARDVAKFWNEQPFDLALDGVNGRTPLGNCDLCFLKGKKLLQGIMRDRPNLANWWIKQENLINATFDKDRPPYKDLLNMTINQGDFFTDNDEIVDCMCLD